MPTRTAAGLAAVLLAVLLATWVGVSAAGAQGTGCTGYAPTQLTIDPTDPEPGDVVTVAGAATPNASVTVTLTGPDGYSSVLGQFTAAPSAAFSGQVTLPTDLPAGDYELVVTSPSCPAPFRVGFPVGPPASPSGTTTTTTSAEVTTTTAGGGGATTTTAVVGGVTTTAPEPASATGDLVGSDVEGAVEERAEAGSRASGGLAFTGGEVRPMIVAAIAVIAIGALLVGSTRRRN